jgi:O-antigen/teichoic acid export membrane protein
VFRFNIKKNKFTKDFALLLSGVGVAQSLPLITSPIITRLYTPADFGNFAVYAAIVGVFSVFIALGYENSLMVTKDNNESNIVLMASIYISTLNAILLFIALIMVNKEIIINVIGHDLSGWIYFIPFAAWSVTLVNIIQNYMNRKEDYKGISKIYVIKSLVYVVMQILCGLMSFGFFGLILSQFISQLLVIIKKISKIKIGILHVSMVTWEVLVNYKNFPIYNMPHGVLNALTASVPIFILTKIFDEEAAGNYSFALMVALSPAIILGTTLSKILNRNITELYNSGLPAYSQIVDIIRKIFIIGLIPFSVAFIYGANLFAFIFGDRWIESGRYLEILIPYIFILMIVSTLSFIPNLYKKQRTYLILQVIYIVSQYSSMLIGAKIFGSIYWALILYSLTSSFILLGNLMWFLKITKRNV